MITPQPAPQPDSKPRPHSPAPPRLPIPMVDLAADVEDHWDALVDAFKGVLRSGQFILGPEVEAFEREAAAFLGVRHAVGLNSGTDALVIGLRALGIGPGDEVVTTPFTMFATAEAISSVGAEPVFADVHPEAFTLDPDAVASCLTPRTKAILPVHLFGRPADMDGLLALAEAHGLFVVEDCAQAFGAGYDGAAGEGGARTGSRGHAGAFSFFPTKNLGACGDGGLLTTNDAAVAGRAVMLRQHGAVRKYHNEAVGYNSRLDAVQAALLRVRLPHVEAAGAGRRRVAAAYTRRLAGIAGIGVPEATPGHVFNQYTIRVTGGRRDHVRACLEEAGVSTMHYYPVPLDQLPLYARRKGAHRKAPVSARLAGEVLSLPMWPTLDDDRIAYIAAVVTRAMADAPSAAAGPPLA